MSDTADASKGLATGLITTGQRMAVTVGIPTLGAVMTIRAKAICEHASGRRRPLSASVTVGERSSPFC